MIKRSTPEIVKMLPLSDLYAIYNEHRRLKVFVRKGRECVTCKREGTTLLITRYNNGGIHVDLYSDDFVLMTVDHIVPKSVGKQLGWATDQIEDLSNKQPMCGPCNSKKGSKYPFDMKIAPS